MSNKSELPSYKFSGGWILNTILPNKGDEISLYDPETLNDDGDCSEIFFGKEDAEALANHFDVAIPKEDVRAKIEELKLNHDAYMERRTSAKNEFEYNIHNLDVTNTRAKIQILTELLEE
jgi:hypothetical protein